MPAAYSTGFILPPEYNVPDELRYDYMIHKAAKCFGITLRDAGEFSEYDFRKMTAFEKLDLAKEEYIRELIINQNTNR